MPAYDNLLVASPTTRTGVPPVLAGTNAVTGTRAMSGMSRTAVQTLTPSTSTELDAHALAADASASLIPAALATTSGVGGMRDRSRRVSSSVIMSYTLRAPGSDITPLPERTWHSGLPASAQSTFA